MKRKFTPILIILTLGVAFPAAQMAAPQPLQEDLYDWMVGEWEGATESTMGKTTDEMKVDWDLEHQFVEIHYKQKMGEGATSMVYKGRGMMTVNAQTKEYAGYWFGSFRDISIGKGSRSGNKITMTWEGGAGPETRTIEKMAADKIVMTFKGTDQNGKEMSGTTTLVRKVKKDKAAKKD